MTSTTYTAFKQLGWEPHGVMLLAAARKSGKTTLVENLLLKGGMVKHYDNIVIASPSLKYNDDYKKVESTAQYTVIKVEDNLHQKITTLLEDQKKAFLHAKKYPDVYDPPSTLLILDDCIDSGLASWNSSMNIADEIAERGRHYGVSMIASAQYLSGLSPSLRRNAEYLVVFSPTQNNDTERILREYVSSTNRKEFIKQFNIMFKEPYSFLMLDNTSKKRTYEKLRFRKGFTELLIPMTPGELDDPHLRTKKRKGEEKEKEEKEEEEEEESDNEIL